MLTRVRILLVALTCATVAGAVLVGGTTPAAGAASPRQGLGYSVGGDFVGYYRTSAATKIYCLSPRAALPARVSLHTVARYGGVAARSSHALAYALSTWGDARSAYAAAAESQVLNTLIGNRADVARRAAHLPKSLGPLVRRHVTQARRLAGPYTTSVRAPRALAPGQTATGTVVVTSAAGHRLRDVAVRLHGTRNVSVPGRVTIGRSGRATFRYRAVDVGEARVTATAIHLPATTLRTNHPSPGQQHMVTWSAPQSSHGRAGFGYRAGGFSNAYACTSRCSGDPALTLSACAPPSGYPSRVVYRVAGRTLRVNFPAGTTRMCRAVTVTAHDGDHVSAAWQYRTPHGWTRPLSAHGAFTVDCPPVPAVSVAMTYDCTAASVTIALARANPSYRRAVLVIGGAAQRRIYAQHGERATFTATASCTAAATYTARAGVQRAGGGWNYGPASSVTAP